MAMPHAQCFNTHSAAIGRIFWRIAGIAIMCVCSITPAATGKASGPKLDTKSKRVVDGVTRWLARQKQLQVVMKQTTEVKGPGMQT